MPQNEKIILCLTDPLTTSEMKRYFNSIHALKFFKSKLMQQKRKRQYVMPVLADNNFFQQAVFLMEYGRTVIDDKVGGIAAKGDVCVVHPVAVFKEEYTISGSSLNKVRVISSNSDNDNDNILQNKNERNGKNKINSIENYRGEKIVAGVGLKVSVRVANSQYFMENLIQSILTFITLKNDGYYSNIINSGNNGGKNNNGDNNQFNSDTSIITQSDTIKMNIENNQNTDTNDIEVEIESVKLLDKKVLSSFSILLGGDGRIMNEHAVEIATRVSTGNNVKSVLISQNLFLTTSAAATFLQQQARTASNGTYGYCCFSYLFHF